MIKLYHGSNVEIEEGMTQSKRIEFLKLALTNELVGILVEERGCSIEEAFSLLYRSRTYARLSDPNTLLYTQSSGYVYSLLEDELGVSLTGK